MWQVFILNKVDLNLEVVSGLKGKIISPLKGSKQML